MNALLCKKIKNEHLIEHWSFDLKMPIFGQRDSKKGIREIYTKEYFAVMIVYAAFFCIHPDVSSVEIVTDRALAKSEKFFLAKRPHSKGITFVYEPLLDE